jgi:hypothetical protein
MRAAQKNKSGNLSGFSFSYTFAGTGRPAAIFVMTLAGLLAFTGCDNFMGKQQDDRQLIPPFKHASQNVLTIEPPSVIVAKGNIQAFTAKMGGYAAGVKWTLSGDISKGTKMSGNRLIVAENQLVTTLTLMATLSSNGKYKATATILVDD